jgi:hypothetical protein
LPNVHGRFTKHSPETVEAVSTHPISTNLQHNAAPMGGVFVVLGCSNRLHRAPLGDQDHPARARTAGVGLRLPVGAEGEPGSTIHRSRSVDHRSRRIHHRRRRIDNRSRGIDDRRGRINHRSRSIDHRRRWGRRRRVNNDWSSYGNKPSTVVRVPTPTTRTASIYVSISASGASGNPDSDAPSPASDADAPGDVTGVECGSDRG